MSLRVCAQAFSAVLDQVVSMRDRERARDGSVNILSLRTSRVFSDHKQETDSSTKGLVCLPLNQVKDRLWSQSLSPALHPLFSLFAVFANAQRAHRRRSFALFAFSDLSCAEQGGAEQQKVFLKQRSGLCRVSYSCSVSRMCFCHASANVFCSGFPLGIQCTLLHFASAVDL